MIRYVGSSRAGLAFVAVVMFVAGCTQPPLGRMQQCRRDLDQAREQIRQLELKVVERNRTVASQWRQIEQLQSLGPDRLGKLTTVERIGLERLTGGFSSDEKVGDEGIVIYVQPLDATGHTIKAAGSVVVEFLDLANPDGQRLLGRWRFDADQLRKLWQGRFWTNHYSIRCLFSSRPQHDEITVRVQFTELLTGKTFTAQKLCKIDLPAG